MKIEEETLLEELILNHVDNSEDPQLYMFPSDLAEKYDVSRAAITDRLESLRERGLVELDNSKTKHTRSVLMNKHTVFKITDKATEKYGGLGTELRNFTARPSKPTLDNLHGDLVIKYEILDQPGTETVEWDSRNELENGVEHKIKRIGGPEGERATLELFEGTETATATLKPRLEGIDTDNLMERLNTLAWNIYRDLQHNGYDVGMPERTGEGKFTIVSEELPDDLKGENFLIDESRGEPELHPKTGDLESNAEMAKMLTETGYMAEASSKIDNLEQKVDRQAQVITRMTDVINDLVDQLGDVGEQIENPTSNTPDEPGGNMYG